MIQDLDPLSNQTQFREEALLHYDQELPRSPAEEAAFQARRLELQQKKRKVLLTFVVIALLLVPVGIFLRYISTPAQVGEVLPSPSAQPLDAQEMSELDRFEVLLQNADPSVNNNTFPPVEFSLNLDR